ncbi:MAG: DNA polymerase III subunit gamma/tau [Planctomycetes bacterium]|nr:DNA polymerase III subunit gamma/tau [Planctomycetota bacterium]
MSYLVLARKYRPKTFDDFVGQEAIAQTLRNAVDSDRVAHAYLFSGDRGLGKTSMVRVFAKALNCVKGPTGKPCNKCEACQAIHRGEDIDVVEIDGASHRTVDEISDVLQNVKYRPSRSRFKIYIIDEVHMLSTHAFNALLKTLEEPPPHVKFFFATTEPNKVLDTIKSRCQRFDFRRIAPPAIAEGLGQICKAEKVKADKPTLMAVARAARGSMRDALSILDQLMSFCGKKLTVADVQQILGLVTDEKIAALVKGIGDRDAAAVLKELDERIAMGADVLDLLDQLVDYLRDLMVVASCQGDLELVKNTVSDPDTVTKQSKLFSVEKLLYMIQILSETRRKIREGLDPRIVAEMMLVRLTAVEDMQSLPEILRRLEAMDMGSGAGALPRPSYPDSTQKKTEHRTPPVKPKPDDAEPSEPPPAEEAPMPQRPPGPIGFAEVRKRWGEVIQAMKEEKISLGYFLGEGEVQSVGNGTVAIAFSAENGAHRKMLEDRPNRELLEGCIEKVLGARFQVKFTTTEKSATKEERARPPAPQRFNAQEIIEKEPMVRKALEILGGRIVRVEE